MKNNALKIIFFMCAISIFALNTAHARVCYLPDAEQCEGMPGHEGIEIGYVKPQPTPDTPEIVTPEPEEEYFCKGFDLDAPLGEYYVCSDCSDSLGVHYKCVPLCRPDKCGEDEIYNEKTCMCDQISEPCKKFFNRFKSVAYTPMTPSECNNAKDELGLHGCATSAADYYAGAVMACGGAENVISPDEAEELAYCMYNPTDAYSSMYGDRYDGFLKSYDADTSDHVFVWVNWEGSNPDEKGAVVRMYDDYGSIPYYAERSGSMYYIDDGVETQWENASVLSHTLCRI